MKEIKMGFVLTNYIYPPAHPTMILFTRLRNRFISHQIQQRGDLSLPPKLAKCRYRVLFPSSGICELDGYHCLRYLLVLCLLFR